MLASIDLWEGALALLLGLAALVCLFDRHVLRAAWAFGVFALLMTLAWAWLGAPWLAAAELALGVLLTGTSLFYALGAFEGRLSRFSFRDMARLERAYPIDTFRGPMSHRLTRALLTLAWCVMVGAVIRIVMPAMTYAPSEHPLMLVAVLLVGTAMGAFALHRHRLRRLLAFNVLGSGVFLLMVGLAGTMEGAQALVAVGLLIAGLGSLAGALLIRRLRAHEDDVDDEHMAVGGGR